MILQDARTISPEDLLDRRKQAIMLFKQGKTRIGIAEIVGVHRNTVGQWVARWRKGGVKKLRARPSGRPNGSGRSLTRDDERHIRRLLIDRNPEQLKLDFALWTRPAVRLVVEQETGVKLAIRTVGNYLKRWGFTPQKPVRRAYERCPMKVRRWLGEDYPKIAQKARQEGAEIHWGDETGLRSDETSGRGYAPKGKTPERRGKGTPEKINMISTVTNQGKVRFMFYKQKMNAALLIDFMKRLIRDASGRKIYLILDNLRVHHAKLVKEWIESRHNLIELHYLPSYSPDLNPDEFLNCDLKGQVSRRSDSRRKGRLAHVALSSMRRIQKRPETVKSYFNAKPIQYAR